MDDHFLAPLSHTADGVTLRAWQLGDGEAMAATTVASHDHLRPWMPWATPDDTAADAEVRARLFRARYLAREDFTLGIWDGRDLVGGTGFHPRWGGVGSGVAEIGMWIAGDRAGRGLGTRVLRVMVGWGLSGAWPWRRLVWLCDGRNIASARVAQKAGFRLEGNLRGPGPTDGTWRDATLVYGVNREDLEAVADRDVGTGPGPGHAS